MISSLLGLETSEGLDLKNLDGGVELLLGILLLVLGSRDSHSHESWHVSAASGPEESVKLSVNSHILKKISIWISILTEVWNSLVANFLMFLTA